MILFGRQRAGGIRREGARRVLSFVEIQLYFAVLGSRSIEEPPGRVGLTARGEIAKDEEQLLVLGHRFQPQPLPVESELHIAWTGFGFGIAQDVRDRNHLWLLVRHETSRHTVPWIDR